MKHNFIARACAISAPRASRVRNTGLRVRNPCAAMHSQPFQHSAVAATPRRTMGLSDIVAKWLRIVEKLATVRWLQVVFNVSGMLLQQYPKALRDRVSAIGRGVAAPRRP